MSWRSQSYEEVPALAVRGPELRGSLRTITVAWMFGVVWMACISSSHVPVFSRIIGFNNFHFGLMAAIPFLATFSQLFAALLIERTGLRKYQFMHCATAHRLMWIPIGLVPFFLPIPSGTAVTLVLVLLGASWFMESLARPAWMTWMGDLIPRRIRGRYFARRSRRTQAIMVLAVIALGLLMDHNWQIWSFVQSHVHLPFIQNIETSPQADATAPKLFVDVTTAKDRREGVVCWRNKDSGWDVRLKTEEFPGRPGDSTLLAEMQKSRLMLWTICGVFIIGALFGAKDILLFRRVREVRPSIHRAKLVPPALSLGRQLAAMLIDPMRDRVFRHYVLYGFGVTFSICVSSVYFWIHAMQNLGFSQLATNLLFLVVGPLADMTASPVWGKIIDRWGRRPVLIAATLGTLGSVAPWLFATPHTPHPQFLADGLNWIAAAVGGLFGHGEYRLVTGGTPLGAYMLALLGCTIGGATWSGANLAQLSVMLNFGDGSGRSKAVAAGGVLISMGGLLGGIAGGAITQSLENMPAIGPFLWGNLHVVFFVSILARIASVSFLIGMPDPGVMPVRALLAHMRVNIYNAVQSRAYYPLRIFGWGRETTRKD